MALRRIPVHLYNGVQRGLERLGRAAPHWRAEALLDAAREATGLFDFGDERFREGLLVLCDAYQEEAQLTPFGRMLAQGTLVGTLASRLSVEDAWQRNPELLGSAIRRPIFVLGLPRTGTTALHHLLAQDPANQVLEYWLAAAPGPRPPRSAWARDPRYKSAVRELRMMYFLDPSLKAVHLMMADGPEECRHLLAQSLLDDTFDSNATVPSYTKWFARQDVRPAYARHRDVLKLIQSSEAPRRWVLKYPAHLRNLPVLFETYPDACVVQTHRDPGRVLPSICSLVAGWRALYEGRVDEHSIGSWQLDMWSTIMRDAIPARDALNPDQFFDLPFAELVGDPVAAVRRVYAHFGFELSAEAERRMRDWHAENPQGKHGVHRYSAAQFGLSEDEMARRFAPYVERFEVAREA